MNTMYITSGLFGVTKREVSVIVLKLWGLLLFLQTSGEVSVIYPLFYLFRDSLQLLFSITPAVSLLLASFFFAWKLELILEALIAA